MLFGGDDLIITLHDLSLQLSAPPPSYRSNKMQNGDILVLANPDPPGKWPLKRWRWTCDQQFEGSTGGQRPWAVRSHTHMLAPLSLSNIIWFYLDRFFGIERRAHFAFDVAIDGSLTDALCVVQLGITRLYNHLGECRSFGFVR